MKRLFLLYIPIFLFSLFFIVTGLREAMTEGETTVYSPDEQLSILGNQINLHSHPGFFHQLGADEGITTTHGRRFGLNKTSKTNVYFRNHTSELRNKPPKLASLENTRHFIQYLTVRHSQGFYIYSLKELLL